MDYEKKYKEITTGLLKCVEGVDEKYPECNGFEKCVISLRTAKWNYGDIQKKLGMPPKKEISSVLKKWAPELIDNSKKKVISISNWESELYNIVKKLGKSTFDIEDEEMTFYIKKNKLYFDGWGSNESLFHDLNEITQHQFLIAIKDQLNAK